METNLQEFFDELNEEYFKGRLDIKQIVVNPHLEMGEGQIFAYYDSEKEVIAFNPFVIREGKEFTRKIMHHEMVHRWMHQNDCKQSTHGKLFWDLARRYREKRVS